MREWLDQWTKPAIDPQESDFVRNEHGDIFSIVETSRTPLRRALERFEVFFRLFRRDRKHLANDSTYPYDPNTTIYQDDKRIDSFVNFVVCMVGYVMLVTPLWILFFVDSRRLQLGVITLFIAVFLGIIQTVNVAKPFESLAATAASVHMTEDEKPGRLTHAGTRQCYWYSCR